jgi:hypothetical protein
MSALKQLSPDMENTGEHRVKSVRRVRPSIDTVGLKPNVRIKALNSRKRNATHPFRIRYIWNFLRLIYSNLQQTYWQRTSLIIERTMAPSRWWHFTFVQSYDSKIQQLYFWQSKMLTGCQTRIPSPSTHQPECQRFLKMAKKEYEDWPNIDEFEIYEETSLNRLAKCYREMDEDGLGWCGTNMSDDIANPVFDIQPDHGSNNELECVFLQSIVVIAMFFRLGILY